jgi:hypothetical protein
MSLIRSLVATAAAVALAALGAAPAAADTPPAATGSTIHGFLAKRGVVRAIDHPDAAKIARLPDGITGTSTLGINDRGQILGVYERRDGVVRHFLRDRKGRFTIIDDPPGTSSDRLSYEALDINNRGEVVGDFGTKPRLGDSSTSARRLDRGRGLQPGVSGARTWLPESLGEL